MNRFNKAPAQDEFALIPDGTYDAILENAVMDDVAVWVDGKDTGEKTTGIKLTFRLISDGVKNRKTFKTLKFNTDKDFEVASNQLDHLGVWDIAKTGADEAACINLAATEIFKMVEGPMIVLYVGNFNDRNYCKIQKTRTAETAQPVNHAPQATQMPAPPQFDADAKLPF